jgi:hypothetical protein
VSAPEPRPSLRQLGARLAHDVGKYAARTARNVAPQAWTPELAGMLCRDLFELPGGRASAVFATLAAALEENAGPQPALARVRGMLAEIDALENAVREGAPESLARAARLALDVERALREFAHNLLHEAP